jgi:hypothetical protein
MPASKLIQVDRGLNCSITIARSKQSPAGRISRMRLCQHP